MDLSSRHMETPLSEDSEDEEVNEWKDASVDRSDLSQLFDELDNEFAKLKNVKSTSVMLNERYEKEMDRIHSLQATKRYKEARDGCELLLRGELRHRCENAEFWIQFAHIEESIGDPDSVIEVYDRGCTCLRCIPSELLTLSLDMRSYVENVIEEEETVEVLDISQDEFDKIVRKDGYEFGSVKQEEGKRDERGRKVVESDNDVRDIENDNDVKGVEESDSDVKAVENDNDAVTTNSNEAKAMNTTKDKPADCPRKRKPSTILRSSSTDSELFITESSETDSEYETKRKSQHTPYRSRRLRGESTPVSIRKSPRLRNRVNYGKML